MKGEMKGEKKGEMKGEMKGEEAKDVSSYFAVFSSFPCEVDGREDALDSFVWILKIRKCLDCKD